MVITSSKNFYKHVNNYNVYDTCIMTPEVKYNSRKEVGEERGL